MYIKIAPLRKEWFFICKSKLAIESCSFMDGLCILWRRPKTSEKSNRIHVVWDFVAKTTNRMTRLSVSLWLPSAESISSWSWSDFWLHARLLQINWWKNKTCHHESVLKNDKHIPDIHGHKKHKLMKCGIISF